MKRKGAEEGWSFLLGIIISVILIGLFALFFMKGLSSENDEDHFLDLVSFVNKMEEGESVFLYHIDQPYVLVGFSKDKNFAGIEDESRREGCYDWRTLHEGSMSSFYIPKPEKCEDSACLCLCTVLDLKEEPYVSNKEICSKSTCKKIDVDKLGGGNNCPSATFVSGFHQQGFTELILKKTPDAIYIDVEGFEVTPIKESGFLDENF